jgi:hypothetical protein
MLLVFGVFLTSCGLFKKSCNHQNILYSLPDDAAQKLAKNAFLYDDLNIRAKVVYASESEKHSFTMNVKMKRDSAIWVSISGFGFEVMRVLIEPDSVKMINKLSKSYYTTGIEDLKNMIHFDVNLNQLQQILVGNTPFAALKYSLHDGENKELIKKEAFIKSLLELNESYRISKNSLLQDGEGDSLVIHYSNFQKLKKMGCIPGKVFADFGKGKTTVQIQYNSVTSTKIDNLPFNVPPTYKNGFK